jgi:hypothetical protein
MRVFRISPAVLRALASGCPKLHDALAEAMIDAREDPEVHVLRDSTSETDPPRWSIAVEAGDDIRELDLDVRERDAAQAAIALFLIAVIDDLRRELPDLMAQPVIIEGIIQLLVAASKQAGRVRPS